MNSMTYTGEVPPVSSNGEQKRFDELSIVELLELMDELIEEIPSEASAKAWLDAKDRVTQLTGINDPLLLSVNDRGEVVLDTSRYVLDNQIDKKG